ncbi:MAG: tRNA pseudouridine(13) synthase TruD [SAR86 cluster bacterium]
MSQDYALAVAYAQGQPSGSARLKQQAVDFVVNERLGFEPSGIGEHCYVRIRKTGANTAWVAENLARYLNIKPFDVNYAGRKDRHAVTTQWLSCHLPGKLMPDFADMALTGVEIVETCRHDKKLRRGSHAGNEFEIRLRDIQADSQDLEQRLAQIAAQGFPNYFGEQRFGRGGSNLLAADKLFAGEPIRPQQRDMCLSAVRSYMFNADLSRQVSSGELSAISVPEHCWTANEEAGRGADSGGRTRSSGESNHRGWLYGLARKETPALKSLESRFPLWCEGLRRLDLKAQQRDLWVRPAAFNWRFEGADLLMSFGLPVGSFATSLIREIVSYGEQ